MLVPKAAVNEDDLLPTLENNVRLAGEIGTVKTEAVAQRVKHAPH